MKKEKWYNFADDFLLAKFLDLSDQTRQNELFCIYFIITIWARIPNIFSNLKLFFFNLN
jgi:hypothetical protein